MWSPKCTSPKMSILESFCKKTHYTTHLQPFVPKIPNNLLQKLNNIFPLGVHKNLGLISFHLNQYPHNSKFLSISNLRLWCQFKQALKSLGFFITSTISCYFIHDLASISLTLNFVTQWKLRELHGQVQPRYWL